MTARTSTSEGTKTAVAIVPEVDPDAYAIMFTEGNVGDALRENLDGASLSMWDLARIRVPAGGGTTWIEPTVDGDQETKGIEGVIVHMRTVRSMWRQEFSGEGTPPDCSSTDGVTGMGDPGGACRTCPYAAWGTSPKGTGAQACKQARLLFVLRPADLLPVVVAAPPSSLKAVKQYLLRLAGAGAPYHAVITRLELERTKNAGGIAYAQIVPRLIAKLAPPQAATFRAYGESLALTLDEGPAPAHGGAYVDGEVAD